MTAPQTLYAVGGPLLFGVTGAWQQWNVWRSAGARWAIAAPILAVGALLAILGALQSSENLALTISSAVMMAGIGASLGGTIVDEIMTRRPGMIHAVLSDQRQTGLIWVGIVACACGLPISVIRLFQPPKSGWEFYTNAQFVFWMFFALRTFVVARTKWSFAQPGVLAPTGLIPWRRIVAYEWTGETTLELTIRDWLRKSRKITIQTIPAVRAVAEPILERNVARQNTAS